MSKDTVAQWSTTAASNTDVGGVDLAENSMRPRDVNNAIRTMMAQVKNDVFLNTGGTLTGILTLDDGTTAPVLVFDGDTGTGIAHPAANQMAFWLNNAEVARLRSARFGIGTTDPQLPLHVLVPSGTNGFRFETTGGLTFDLSTSGTTAFFTNYATGGAIAFTATGSAGTMGFFLNSAERVRLTGTSLRLLSASLSRAAPVTKTADFTLGDAENWVINNKSGSACVVTLPAASSYSGREVMFKNTQAQQLNSASSNVVPLAGGAAASAILTANSGRWATLVSDGTNWTIMAGVI